MMYSGVTVSRIIFKMLSMVKLSKTNNSDTLLIVICNSIRLVAFAALKEFFAPQHGFLKSYIF